MVLFQIPAMQQTFRALADPTRRDILMMLSHDDLTISEVVEQFDISRAAIKKHLTVLEAGGLIKVSVAGRQRINRLTPGAFKDVSDWLSYFDQYWDNKLNKLEHAVNTAKR